ncbi:MAG: 23S rRNA (pseudouridine(1915)-N(3))-methyltransferase RlmH [Tissierellia bacterium]|nr:23S rRNA (pseudouridine(1915)-N(3))-methyltransferase RlmH [Tissierellia bacterium]
MSIRIIAVGKLKEKYLKSGIDEYLKRMQSYSKLEVTEIPDEQAPENLSEKDLEIIKNKEGEKILSKIKKEDYVINLEINGKLLSSEDLAGLIERNLPSGRDLVFIIGGSNGLSQNVINRGDFSLSFSKMTFPHQLMRLVLIEQIYRGFRIINNHPYHK